MPRRTQRRLLRFPCGACGRTIAALNVLMAPDGTPRCRGCDIRGLIPDRTEPPATPQEGPDHD